MNEILSPENFLKLEPKEQLLNLAMAEYTKEDINVLYRELMLSSNPDTKVVLRLKEIKKDFEQVNMNIVNIDEIHENIKKAFILLLNYKNIFELEENKKLIENNIENLIEEVDIPEIKIINGKMVLPDNANLEDLALKAVSKTEFIKNRKNEKGLFEVLEKKDRESFLEYVKQEKGIDSDIDLEPFYHGSPFKIKELKKQAEIGISNSGLDLRGVHFANDIDVAKEFALSRDEESKPTILTAFVLTDKDTYEELNYTKFNQALEKAGKNKVVIIEKSDNGSGIEAKELIVDNLDNILYMTEEEWLKMFNKYTKQIIKQSVENFNDLDIDESLVVKEKVELENKKTNKMKR